MIISEVSINSQESSRNPFRHQKSEGKKRENKAAFAKSEG